MLIKVLLVFITSVGALEITTESRENSGFLKYLNKCCPAGKLVGPRKKCVYSNVTRSFNTTKVYDNGIKETGKTLQDVFSLKPNRFDDLNFKSEALDVSWFPFNTYVTEDGVLQLELPNAYDRWTPIPPANYCIDYRITSKMISETPRFWVILPSEEFVQTNMFLTYAMLISCFFLLLVLLVHFMLPELQNLCGLILMAYVFSLFMAFLLLAIIQIQLHTTTSCVWLTMFIYYFFLATFCWMSVMSYDIWWTFRGYAKARPIHRRGEMFKFLMYCLFAFGVPFLMTVGLYVLNEMKRDMKHLPWFVTPNVPESGCFLEGGVKLLYLYIPMLILIIGNWMFYLMTVFNISRLSRGVAAGSPQAHRTQKNRFMIYLKLSVVMGLSWLLEIISFLFPGFKIWWLSDIYNIFLGFAIFIIFCWKKEILKLLCKRYLGMYGSMSDSNQQTASLQLKAPSKPNELNGYA